MKKQQSTPFEKKPSTGKECAGKAVCHVSPAALGELLPEHPLLKELKRLQSEGCETILIIDDFATKLFPPINIVENGLPEKSFSENPFSQKFASENTFPEKLLWEESSKWQSRIFPFLDPQKTRIHFSGEWLEPVSFGELVSLLPAAGAALDTSLPECSLQDALRLLCQSYVCAALSADIILGNQKDKPLLEECCLLSQKWSNQKATALLI